jgi:hypothetical protein
MIAREGERTAERASAGEVAFDFQIAHDQS